MSCHIISYYIILHYNIFSHIVSYVNFNLYYVISCHVISCHVILESLSHRKEITKRVITIRIESLKKKRREEEVCYTERRGEETRGEGVNNCHSPL